MMQLFTPYISIRNFLQRYTLVCIHKLHIRIHSLLGDDKTELFHSHPFHYISIILAGGYDDVVLSNGVVSRRVVRAPAIIIGSKNKFHRLENVKPNTKTLFFAYGKYTWRAKHPAPTKKLDGIFIREVKGCRVFCKRELGVWFIGHADLNTAENETRHSIFQI